MVISILKLKEGDAPYGSDDEPSVWIYIYIYIYIHMIVSVASVQKKQQNQYNNRVRNADSRCLYSIHKIQRNNSKLLYYFSSWRQNEKKKRKRASAFGFSWRAIVCCASYVQFSHIFFAFPFCGRYGVWSMEKRRMQQKTPSFLNLVSSMRRRCDFTVFVQILGWVQNR